ncbi:MAG: FAD-binding protein [Vicinamibacteria bacterium]
MAKGWQNWSNSVRHPDLEALYRPRDLQELKANVKEAAANGWKLRVVGSGHSWSNLGLPATGGAVMQLDRLDAVLGVEGQVVEVEGGISIARLNDELFERGLALPNMGDANPQAIAGAISTETHGSGVTLGSLSEFVEGITIVRADGEEQVLGGEELQAGRISLGQLGVIYSVKLGVLPNYFLRETDKLVRFRDEQGAIEDLLKNRHLEYWFYPYSEKAIRITRDPVDSTEEVNLMNWFDNLSVAASARFVERKGRLNPEALPAFYRGVMTEKTFPTEERQGPWHKILVGKANSWRKAIKTYTMEYLLPYQHLWQAFDEMEKSIELAQKKRVFVACPTQIRFTKKSERSLLSHFVHEPTVSFSISLFTTNKGAHTWLPEIEKRLINLEGKPHWGKMYYVRPQKDPRFERIQKKLDPNGMFAFEQTLYVADPEAFRDP